MDNPFHIVILGGGTAGWMAANLFAHHWSSRGVRITLVESPEIGIVGVGEGSTPTLKRFFEMLNISESQWMPRTNATYKLNIKFSGWSPASGIENYSHPFVSQTDTFTERAFYVNCRTRRLGLDTHTKPEDFFINGALARQGKGPIASENFPFKMEYGYHFDSHLLGKFLSEHGASLGVEHKQAKVASVVKHSNGDISHLVTECEEQIKGDFFIDCTGLASVLIDKTLGVPFQSFKDNLFNDSAVVLPTSVQQKLPVETLATALSNGWVWNIPLTQRTGNGYVYSSDFINADQAETEIRRHLGMLDSDVQCRHLKMRVGQVKEHWNRNVLALGLSQGFIEPLEATALHLVQVSIEMFITDFQDGSFSDKNRSRFNQRLSERFERVRDYIVAHYKLNTRDDSEYWLANRNNENLSQSLLQILHVWYSREDLAVEIDRQNLNSHFDTASWHCLFAGYGAFPKLAPNQPNKGDLFKDQQIDSFLRKCALNFRSHQHHLDSL